jgi:diadenosine tetraphosphate (Ap4A) HIT family hydrolase
MPVRCPFCNPDEVRVWLRGEAGLVLWDAFPVVEGHTLVVPRKHVTSLYDLPPEQQAALWQLVAEARQLLATRVRAAGFNIGLNDGQAAGQTVMHAHIHLIPRRHGDIADPRGGVRWMFPTKARYW